MFNSLAIKMAVRLLSEEWFKAVLQFGLPSLLLTPPAAIAMIATLNLDSPDRDRETVSTDHTGWLDESQLNSPFLTTWPTAAIENGEPEDEEPELYTEKIYSCQVDDKYVERRCADNSDCPFRIPEAYSKTFKYPLYPDDYRKLINKTEYKFCWNTPLTGSNRFEHGRHIPEFCEEEILQLRLDDMPANVSNQTAIQVNWGITANPVPFYCPARFSTYDKPHSSRNYCPSQACRQKLPLRHGDTKYTYGTFYEVGDKWVLNLKLHETAGRWGLAVRIYSCPPLAPPGCELWRRKELCNEECVREKDFCCKRKDWSKTYCGIRKRIQCCSYETNFVIRITKLERNGFVSPVTIIGDRIYNVTLIKNEAYDSINVTNILTGKTIREIESNFGPELINVTLSQGVYQVSGTSNHKCGAAELSSPITLLPVDATLASLKFIDFPLRKLTWETHSDLPVIRYEFYRQGEKPEAYNSTLREITVNIGGDQYLTPAQLKQTFLHRIEYKGINEQNEPVHALTIDLTEFQPSHLAVSYNDTHTELQWQKPESHTDQLVKYLLNTASTSINPDRSFDVTPGKDRDENFTYPLFHPFPVDETLQFRLGAVYMNKLNNVLWWGPETTLLIDIPTRSSSHPMSSSTAESSTTPAVTPTLTPPTENRPAIIIGSSLAATSVVAAATVGTVITICICIKKRRNSVYPLNDPVSDEGVH